VHLDLRPPADDVVQPPRDLALRVPDHEPSVRIGKLLGRGGGQSRGHSPINCNHGSLTSRFRRTCPAPRARARAPPAPPSVGAATPQAPRPDNIHVLIGTGRLTSSSNITQPVPITSAPAPPRISQLLGRHSCDVAGHQSHHTRCRNMPQHVAVTPHGGAADSYRHRRARRRRGT
jgi:hypothetical protein